MLNITYFIKNILLKMVFIIILIISVFAFIYFSISNSEQMTKRVYYQYPSFQYSTHETIQSPYSDYIKIPKEDYLVVQYDNVNHYLYNFTLLDAIYFSGTTYFTVGYSDLQPSGLLRIVRIIEMLISYMINILVFGIVVSKYIKKSEAKEQG